MRYCTTCGAPAPRHERDKSTGARLCPIRHVRTDNGVPVYRRIPTPARADGR